VDSVLQDLCFDPMTSGGLSIALPEKDAQALLSRLRDVNISAAVIGDVVASPPGRIDVRP
jgi:selenide,water dikinase